MEDSIILLDSSIIIEYLRAKNKKNTTLFNLSLNYSVFAISSVTEFEILCGNNDKINLFWKELIKSFVIFNFDSETASIASNIYKDLKRSNKLIGIPDILIAATSIKNKCRISTLNKKHFNRIENLNII